MKCPASSLVFILFMVLSSCTPDEDPPHPMVGVWQVERIFQLGQELPLDDCAMRTTSEFTAKGMFYEKRFSKRELGCSLNRSKGTWVVTKENVVRITYDDGHADFQNIAFVISGTTMTLTDADGSETFAIMFSRVK